MNCTDQQLKTDCTLRLTILVLQPLITALDCACQHVIDKAADKQNVVTVTAAVLANEERVGERLKLFDEFILGLSKKCFFFI